MSDITIEDILDLAKAQRGHQKQSRADEGTSDPDDGKIPEYMQEFNRKFAVVVLGGSARVLHEYVGHDGEMKIDFLRPNDFHTLLANRTDCRIGLGGAEIVSLSREWLKSSHRREYDGVVFDPTNRCGDRYYNTWKGLAVEPRQGSWKRMKRHIFEVICGCNKTLYIYLLGWLARLVQDPGGERPGVMIILRGKQGTGKGIFVNAMGRILGEHYTHITSQQHLVGKFNAHLEKTLLLFVDEAFFAGDKQAIGNLKGIVTEPTIQIEPKGINAYQARNHLNIIMATNNEHAVGADHQERRCAVYDVSDAHMQDTSYFQAIREELDNGGCEAMLYDLLRFEHSRVNLRHAPRTKGLFDQKMATFDPLALFWFNVLVAGEAVTRDRDSRLNLGFDVFGRHVQSEMLYQAYVDFLDTLKISHYNRKDLSAFSKELKQKYLPERDDSLVKEKRSYPRGREIPSLEKCRVHFEKRMGTSIDWDEYQLELEDERVPQRRRGLPVEAEMTCFQEDEEDYIGTPIEI